MKKHAYLIIAHSNFEILELLVQSIDDPRNDIFVHIDAKAKDVDFNRFIKIVRHSAIHFTKRIDVLWGHVSQIETELNLFTAASQSNHYAYYHILSGVDMPIKSQDDIHKFCALHQGKEFISFQNNFNNWLRVQHIHINKKVRETYRIAPRLEKLLRIIQTLVHYNRVGNILGELKKGSNWVSITDSATRYIIKEMQSKLSLFRYSLCGDEVYKHKIDDFDSLISSPAMFARKFDWSTDNQIIELILEHTKQ